MECGRARVYKIDKLFCVLRVHTLKYTEMQRTGKGAEQTKMRQTHFVRILRLFFSTAFQKRLVHHKSVVFGDFFIGD